MPRRKTTPDTISVEEAKRRFLIARGEGLSVIDSAARAQRDPKTYEYWRKTDAGFREKADQATALSRVRKDTENPRDLSFAEFSETYLGQKVFWHQQQWVDLIEGREPLDIHPAQTYDPGDGRRLLVNTPPHHSKTTTLTVNYVTYRICMNPDVRIKLVSQTREMAMEFLHSVKERLTHPRFTALQAAFGPSGGWKATAASWKQDRIYLDRQSAEKDPTVQALGMNGHIYGARSHLIVIDDAITGKNAHEWERQLRWINREVVSRLGRTGKLVVVGTRIAAIDLYRELRNGDNFSSGKSPWTYFAQPAVLEMKDDPADWVTLWPKSNAPIEEGSEEAEEQDADGMYPAWDGPALANVREGLPAVDWAMVYMQTEVDEASTFPAHAVKGVCGMRDVGPMQAGAPGHRRQGMDGLYVIGSIDPSGTGDTGFVLLAVDKETEKRYVLHSKVISPWRWPAVREVIKDWTETFGVNEWVIEKNMFHAALRHDEETTAYLQGRGVRMTEHHTGSQKTDINIGVSSLAPLFGDWEKADEGRHWTARHAPKIELPKRHYEGVKSLVEQLITWSPDTKNKTDLVMALWFAELRVRKYLGQSTGRRRSHLPNRFATPRGLASRGVVDMREYAQRGA